ncbi:hypothetical protein J2T60_000298 [Natronospira proteinivora]|uniref:Tetratricopeptide repeat protein n=1 Tax=Natronospira proteinivora TaxID=1807133 RepID=A0ABT1G7J9_9GAMM|nr:hypothetical protein [Natronospira proteinivora]MCP1726333.1 hypothetical protein [Natronospira proteinivora]
MRVLVLTALIATMLFAQQVRAADIQEVSGIARSGAVELAMELMDRHQPSVDEDPVAWMRWERERLFLYRSRSQWARMEERVADYPESLNRDFLRWANTERVRALLSLDRPEEARAVLRTLIWSTNPADTERQRPWRRLVVESYLEAGEVQAARTALRRFRQDFGDEDGGSRLMEARLYLQEGDGHQALRVLQALPEADYRALRLAAWLMAEPDQAGEILSRSIQLGFDEDADLAQRRMAWSLAARAAEKTGNRSARIGALERGLGYREDPERLDPMFRLDIDELWTAYQEYGERLGNEARILVGDDPMWFDKAQGYLGSDPIKARALLSVIAHESYESSARNRAHALIAGSLDTVRHGPALLRRLYLDSHRFPDAESIPRSVRYQLAEVALDEADIPLASELMRGLHEAPEGSDPQEWQLQRGRVLLLGGQRAEGLAVLEGLLSDIEALDVDRFLQVIFDMQNMGDHEPAYEMLMTLMEGELSDRQHREILFWAAESAEGQGDQAEAARLYLRSAGYLDPFSMDQWAQTARYRAADALADAGLVNDARRLYQSLLNATDDEARRSVLRNRIQRLQTRPLELTPLEDSPRPE